MKVVLNRCDVELSPDIKNLADLLESRSMGGPGRAVAVDNRVIRKDEYSSFLLSDGMKITIIKAVCGG